MIDRAGRLGGGGAGEGAAFAFSTSREPNQIR